MMLATTGTTVRRVMDTVVENDKNLQEGFYRRVSITFVEGEWKCEAWSIHAETKHREFRGCALLTSYEDAMDKAHEWVDYLEQFFL